MSMERDSLLKILRLFGGRRILLFGDLVVDQFLYGEISRISREAPVLILNYETTVDALGAGANAAHNLRALGADVFPVGIVGEDESGEKLIRLLSEKGIDVEGIVKAEGYTTPTKTRILGGLAHSSKQQIVRIDRGAKLSMNSRIEDLLLDKIESGLSKNPNGIIISDYGYGLISERILEKLRDAAKSLDIPIVVDSRFDLTRYCDVTAITPNVTEVEEALRVKIANDLEKLEAVGEQILLRQGLSALVITRGRYGLTVFERNNRPRHIPVFGADEVADVTGAGDTVIATFTLALAAGANYYQAARLANFAGGIVVMKRGTATVSAQELESAVARAE